MVKGIYVYIMNMHTEATAKVRLLILVGRLDVLVQYVAEVLPARLGDQDRVAIRSFHLHQNVV